MSGLSLCDLCLCYSILGSQFSNKYLLTYYNFVADSFHTKNCESARVNKDGTCKRNDATAVSTREHRGLCHCQQYAMCAAHYEYAGVRTQVQCMPSAWHGINNLACIKRAQHAASDPVMTDTHCDPQWFTTYLSELPIAYRIILHTAQVSIRGNFASIYHRHMLNNC